MLAVAHHQFRQLGEGGLRDYGKPQSVVFDVKAQLPAGTFDGRL